MLKNPLIKLIDFFYFPFLQFIPIKTFRYGVTGGSNALLNLTIFFLSYNYILKGEALRIGSYTITSYIGADLMALSVSFPVGFLLNKYLVFQQQGRGIQQLGLYAFVTVSSLLMNYGLLHLLVGYFGFWATPSQAFIIVLMSAFSYFFQSYVTFRERK